MFIDNIPQASTMVGDDIFQHVKTPQLQIERLTFSLHHYPVSLDNLKYFPNLCFLQILAGNKLRSLAPLVAVAHSLKFLQLDRLGCPSERGEEPKDDTSLDPLGSLTQLSALRMEALGLTSSIKPLVSLKQLKVLNLRHSVFLRDLNSVGALHQLEKLNLYGGFFRHDKDNTLDFLRENTELTHLNIGFSNSIDDLSPVFSLNKLKTLLLSPADYTVDSLSGIENLRDLEVLDVGGLMYTMPWPYNSKLVNEEKMQPLKKLQKLHTLAYEDLEKHTQEGWDIRNVIPQVSSVKYCIESSSQDW